MAIVDTLKLARALRDHGGFSQAAAEATAEAFGSSFTEEVATKSDIDDLRAATKRDIDDLREATKRDIDDLRAATKRGIDDLRAATKRDIDDLRAATKLEIAELRAEMARLHNEILKWMFGQTFVILAVVAALHFVK
jgi:ribosomal protein L29